MPRITEFSCIIDSTVLEWMADRFVQNYPIESGVFLFGDYWSLESKFNIPYITLVREPWDGVGDNKSFDYSHKEVLRQTRLAAAEGQMLLGWAHSHPEKFPWLELNCQSIIDARTQIKYRFTISMIFGVWPSGWWCTTWKEGFAAPLDIFVTKGSKLLTIRRWYFDKYKRKSWRNFGVDKI